MLIRSIMVVIFVKLQLSNSVDIKLMLLYDKTEDTESLT